MTRSINGKGQYLKDCKKKKDVAVNKMLDRWGYRSSSPKRFSWTWIRFPQ